MFRKRHDGECHRQYDLLERRIFYFRIRTPNNNCARAHGAVDVNGDDGTRRETILKIFGKTQEHYELLSEAIEQITILKLRVMTNPS